MISQCSIFSLNANLIVNIVHYVRYLSKLSRRKFFIYIILADAHLNSGGFSHSTDFGRTSFWERVRCHLVRSFSHAFTKRLVGEGTNLSESRTVSFEYRGSKLLNHLVECGRGQR